jgi:hypothetical protein
MPPGCRTKRDGVLSARRRRERERRRMVRTGRSSTSARAKRFGSPVGSGMGGSSLRFRGSPANVQIPRQSGESSSSSDRGGVISHEPPGCFGRLHRRAQMYSTADGYHAPLSSSRALPGRLRHRPGRVAAGRHAAPTPGVGPLAIGEHRRAGRTLAWPARSEILNRSAGASAIGRNESPVLSQRRAMGNRWPRPLVEGYRPWPAVRPARRPRRPSRGAVSPLARLRPRAVIARTPLSAGRPRRVSLPVDSHLAYPSR